MSTRRRSVRLIAGAAAAGALLAATAAPASAWPIPLTSEDNNYLGAVRGAWPVDDDTLLMAGRGACRLLYTGSGAQGAIDGTANLYGASPDQAAVVVRAARANFCTQAPG
ncbi:hypothetical protein A5662_21140 [Mycobacteriaceae bacterium 1482268.1]|nr:hypothetical protein A5662_21140 [Mycobacteriaceae bacterium 1482268.1]